MSAQPLRVVAPIAEASGANGRPAKEFTWPQIMVAAPQMAATMTRYLDQLAVSARPATVLAVDLALRQFAGRVTANDPACQTMAQVTRSHFEDYKQWLARRPGRTGTLSPSTISGRLGLLRTFFERIIEWDYHDTPARIPIFAGDFPERDEPLPKFLDDPTAAKFMAALADDPNPRRRLMVEILARTGIRSGELSGLEDNAMTLSGDTHWLRIPVGKLHNDRNIPLAPLLVELINNHRATRGPTRSGRLVERNDGQPFDRRTIHRYVAAVAKQAGISHVHPHQLRHTLATQAINRGMSLEAIAALLGHRSMKMTLTYARISDRTVADEYFRVTSAIEANYQPHTPPPTNTSTDHHRHLANAHCTRPAALNCIHETICERCGFFETSHQFVPVLIRQRDHATNHDQHQRAQLYTNLINNLDNNP